MVDNRKVSNKKSPTKSNNKKPSVIKPKKKESSPILAISLLVTIIAVVGLLIFIFIRRNNNSNPPTKSNKTIYLTAKQEQPSAKIEKDLETEKKHKEWISPKKIENKSSSVLKAEPKNTDIKTSSFQKKESKNTENKTSSFPKKESKNTEKKELSKQINYPNKFVSPAKEWQPINPALRVATNRFDNLVYGGKPITLLDLNILPNTSYYSAYSEKRKNPIWVAYRLDVHKGQNRLSRPGNFITDFRTKSKIDQRVYAKTGYDRGHMCPNSAIAARYGKKGQTETFLMSNITPQKPELNRKVWERLERLEEAYANKFGGIWVITGPIFDQHVELLSHQVEIPDSFYKILIDEDNGKVRVLPFIVPQNVTGKEILNDFLTSVDEIEKQTGLDFFSPMDDEYENKLESYVPGKTMWN